MKQEQPGLKHFVVKLALISISVLIVAGINFYVDPLQYYRKSPVTELYPMERYQVPGIARNYSYNAIILGTSLTENFSPVYIKQKLGYDTVKLTMEGSSIREEYLALKVALDRGQVRNVIWGLDFFSFRPFDERAKGDNADFPYYFYDDNPLNKYNYLINSSTTELALRRLLGRQKPAADETLLLDNYKSWYQQYTFSRATVCQDYLRIRPAKSYALSTSQYNWDSIKAICDQEVIAPVKQHPEVQFTLFYPPYSMLGQCYIMDSCPELFDLQFQMRRYLYQQLVSCPNVRLYDFQADPTVVQNLDHYKDVVHYDQTVNNWMIDSFATERGQVNEASLAAGEAQIRQMVADISVQDGKLLYQGQPLQY